jgi:hypothetical protein
MIHGTNALPDANSFVTRALSVFGAAQGLDGCKRPLFASSPAPKLEVVRGMLSDNSLIDKHAGALRDVETFMPLGLGVRYADGSMTQPDTFVAEKPPSERVTSADLSELTTFLDALERDAGLRVSLFAERGSGAHAYIADEVRTMLEKARIDQERKKPSSRQGQEPPFVIALRSMIDLLALSPDKREDIIASEEVQ